MNGSLGGHIPLVRRLPRHRAFVVATSFCFGTRRARIVHAIPMASTPVASNGPASLVSQCVGTAPGITRSAVWTAGAVNLAATTAQRQLRVPGFKAAFTTATSDRTRGLPGNTRAERRRRNKSTGFPRWAGPRIAALILRPSTGSNQKASALAGPSMRRRQYGRHRCSFRRPASQQSAAQRTSGQTARRIRTPSRGAPAVALPEAQSWNPSAIP
jgi:hypothetical protein